MSDFADFQADDMAFDAMWDMATETTFDAMWDDREEDGWSERDDWEDSYALTSIGWGNDEDYGFFPPEDFEPPF